MQRVISKRVFIFESFSDSFYLLDMHYSAGQASCVLLKNQFYNNEKGRLKSRFNAIWYLKINYNNGNENLPHSIFLPHLYMICPVRLYEVKQFDQYDCEQLDKNNIKWCY